MDGTSTMNHMAGMNTMNGMDMSSITGTFTMSPTSTMHMSMGGMGAMSESAMSMMTDIATATMSEMAGMSGMETKSGSMPMSSSTGMAAMGHGGMKMKCSMSMLWNWNTKDVCFISKQWKTSTRALFGGTCVGVFALLLAINWWRRILVQYRVYSAELRKTEVENWLQAGHPVGDTHTTFTNVDFTKRYNMVAEALIPLLEACKHKWFWALNKNLAVQVDDMVYVYPSILEHILYCIGDTMEWSVHHTIMLLFMYFNGYVFISCMIGAFIGFMLFQYKEIDPTRRGDNVSKRCCL
ncbi:hypothetical protein CAS74_002942 [Pichia kudriavzevii]|uniref:Copper transport protein n=2 Tax=Pichia kudriavzevii TaxID=4909 RepID=A0A1Z8JMZ0_PICKU|nr:hypothetical protein CAS74_002942 [Pichia kudriavzevii]